jgi:hypothetical protein
MESSDLFSHPYEPEFFANKERSDEPVQAPTFSDKNNSTADTPPSK